MKHIKTFTLITTYVGLVMTLISSATVLTGFAGFHELDSVKVWDVFDKSVSIAMLGMVFTLWFERLETK